MKFNENVSWNWADAPDWALAFAQRIYKHQTDAKDFAWIGLEGYHYNPSQKGSKGNDCHCHPFYVHTSMYDFRIIDFRPATDKVATAWDGESIPPAGLLVEAFFPMDTTPAWLPTKLLYVSDQNVIYSSGGDDDQEIRTSRESFNGLNVKFRPIRTAEQIEAEVRDKAIEAMASVITDNPELYSSREEVLMYCTALYDANYRKQVGP